MYVSHLFITGSDRGARLRKAFIETRGGIPLSRRLDDMSESPARFRVASGRKEFGSDGAAFRTDENRLAGWVLVQKLKTVGGVTKSLWKRRFLEVDFGKLVQFKTETPVNLNPSTLDNMEVRMSFEGVRVCMELLANNTNNTSNSNANILKRASSVNTASPRQQQHEGRERVLWISSERGDRIRAIVDKVIAARFAGDTEPSVNFLTTVSDEQGQPRLVTWNGESISVFEKKPKKTIALYGLKVETLELSVMKGTHSKQHVLHIENCKGESIVMTVPDPLLLLQWCGVISGCDADPLVAGKGDHRPTSSVLDHLHVLQMDTASERKRTVSLGLSQLDEASISPPPPVSLTHSASLSAFEGSLDAKGVPLKEAIKKDMLLSDSLPLGLENASMRELMANHAMRKWVYQWSRTQYCSESVKFLTACDTLFSMKNNEDKAKGLRLVCETFIASDGAESVNIRGAMRKQILTRVGSAADADLHELLPGVLHGAMEEVIRVLEFDLHPQFILLLREVYEARAQNSPTSAGGGGGGAATPTPTVPPAVVSSASSSDLTDRATMKALDRMKSVKEIANSEALVEQFLLFCSAKSEKDCALFMSLAMQFRKADDSARKRSAQNIFRSFCDVGAQHFLPFLVDAKKKQTERELLEKILCPPPTLFDTLLMDVFDQIDSTMLFKRFVRSRKPRKKLFRSGKNSPTNNNSNNNSNVTTPTTNNSPTSPVPININTATNTLKAEPLQRESLGDSVVMDDNYPPDTEDRDYFDYF